MGPSPERTSLTLLLAATLLTTGCVSLEPAFVATRALDDQADNGWREDASGSSAVEGGLFSKVATRAYKDDADDGAGYPGVLSVVSVRGVLSPDREALRERVAEALRDEAEAQGLELRGEPTEGERALANGARSLWVVQDARASSQGSVFQSDSTVKVIGEVFRCTGGATVIVTGSAQIDEVRRIGGVQTGQNRDATTWSEMVQDPFGSIEGRVGSRGLIHNIVCP